VELIKARQKGRVVWGGGAWSFGIRHETKSLSLVKDATVKKRNVGY